MAAEVAEGVEVVNKYWGKCTACGGFVGCGGGIARREGAEWKLYCAVCSLDGGREAALATQEAAFIRSQEVMADSR